MPSLHAALTDLRSSRHETLRAVAGLDAALLGTRPAPWRGAQAELRHLVLRLADDDLMRAVRLEAALAAAGHVPSGPQRILAHAQRLRGRLQGSLTGLTAAQFDQGWGDGEWSVRQVLGHMIATDRRYLIAVLYAVERARTGGDGPLRPPDTLLPDRRGVAEGDGAMGDVLARLMATRDEAVEATAGLAAADLDAPTNWVSWDLDVRFRLFRFAEHDREHLVQLRKTYAGIGFVPTETQRILEEAGAVRGALEAACIGVQDGTAAAEIAATMLAETAAEERATVRVILEAAGG